MADDRNRRWGERDWPGRDRGQRREGAYLRGEGGRYGPYGREFREFEPGRGGPEDWRTEDEPHGRPPAPMEGREDFGRFGGDGFREDRGPGPGPHRGRGPRNYTRSDARIHEDVNDRLTENPFLDASDIEVGVSGGEVTLNGSVDSRTAKRLAEDIAEDVSGVVHVQNNLRVRRVESGLAIAPGSGATTPPGLSGSSGIAPSGSGGPTPGRGGIDRKG